MMMPANYSAVAENELTYVVGGGLVDALAPVMNEKNWQNVSVNLIQIVGNSYLNKTSDAFVGTVFGGNYVPGDLGKAAWGTVTKVWDANYEKKNGWSVLKALLNVGLQGAGVASAIYTLGSGTIGIQAGKVSDNVLANI